MHESAGDLEAAFHAAGVVFNGFVFFADEVDEGEYFVDALLSLVFVEPVDSCMEIEVFLAGELCLEGWFLEDDADVLADLVAFSLEVVAADRGVSGCGSLECG